MAYKSFISGETLEASEVNTYLMSQTVMVFANSTERSAITPSEGMVTYLTSTDSLEVYNGSSWIAMATAASVAAVSSRDVLVRFYMEVI